MTSNHGVEVLPANFATVLGFEVAFVKRRLKILMISTSKFKKCIRVAKEYNFP